MVGSQPSQWKPKLIVAGGLSPNLLATVTKLAESRNIEVQVAKDKENIVRISKENLPSIAIIDLASSDYNGFECCHELEWNPEVTAFIIYPDGRKDLLNEAYGWGFDASAEYSNLEARLADYLDANYPSDQLPHKLRHYLWR